MARIVKQLIDTDKKIAVLYGGMSNEREVSLRSGKNVYNALLRLGYKNAELVDVDKNIAETLKKSGYDYAYNALHGKYGEDGCVQGILEILGIPYTGCGTMASAVCMNKEYTKRMLAAAGLPLIKSVFIKKGENPIEKISGLNFPLMLKPVCEGSSIGMFKVSNMQEFEDCYQKSLECNQDILVEEFLTGSGCTVGVLDDVENGSTFATEILEFRTKNEWYDYECKYTAGMTKFILPAEYSEALTEKIKQLAIKAYEACGCKSVSRIDFLVVKDVPYILEINTSPGMTDLSDLPAQALAIGVDYDNLVQLILNSVGLNK